LTAHFSPWPAGSLHDPGVPRSATCERQLLACLIEAAAAGEPCPTNEQLEELGCGTRCAISGLLTRLEARNQVRVQRTGGRRRVRIVHTGCVTDWTRRADDGSALATRMAEAPEQLGFFAGPLFDFAA
jgi:hypothetical protein